METPDFEHGRVYFKQFGAERVKIIINIVKITFDIIDSRSSMLQCIL